MDNNPIIVSGKVIDTFNNPEHPESYAITIAKIELAPPTPAQLAELKEGDEVIIKGKFDGWNGDMVQLIVDSGRGIVNILKDKIVAILPKKYDERYYHRTPTGHCNCEKPVRIECIDDDGEFVVCGNCELEIKDRPKEMPEVPVVAGLCRPDGAETRGNAIIKLIDVVRDSQERISKLEEEIMKLEGMREAMEEVR